MNKKAIYILLVISFILFLILALVFNSKENNAIENSKKSLSVFSNNNNGKSYIYIDSISEIKNGYAIAFSDSDQSIVYLDETLRNKIKEYSFDSRNIKIVGESLEIKDELENNILEIYNADSIEGTEDYLLKEDFSNVFGDYYLYVDKIEDDHTLHKTPSFLSSLFLDLSLVSLLILGFKIILNKGNN